MYRTLPVAAVLWGFGWLSTPQAPPQPAAFPSADSRAKVQVISSSQMEKADAALLAGRQAEIGQAAEFYGYDIASGTWIQSQVLCPYAANHLLIHYLKLSHDGSLSLFTATVPRKDGQVRIIPVLYHGPGAHQVFGATVPQRELINEVVSVETTDQDPDWGSVAYCYAALAGAEPASISATIPDPSLPIMTVSPDGKSRRMHLSTIGSDQLVQDWRIEFDRAGRVTLIDFSVRAIPATAKPREAKLKTRVPSEAVLKSHPVPEGAAVLKPIPEPR